MSKVRIGLLGFGLIGRKHVHTMRGCDDVDIVGVFDPTAKARADAEGQGLRCYASRQELLAAPGLSGVIVASPNPAHAEDAIACIERRVPVLVEKPVTDTAANAERILAAQRSSGTSVLVGHHRRHNPIIRTAREIVASGRLGRVTAVAGLTLFLKPSRYFEIAPWRRELGGGPVLINLIHDIDNLRFIVGEIAAVEAITSNSARGHAVEDTAAVAVRFENGALGTMLVSDSAAAPWSWEMTSRENQDFPQNDENNYLIAGTEGSLALPRLQLWHYKGRAGWQDPLSCETLQLEAADPFDRQLRHFVEVIRGGADPLVTVEDALRTLEVTTMIARASARPPS